jgi:uncharacterized protein YjeT (DUF2065 family)
MQDLLTALGLVLVLEGLLYAAVPERMQQAMRRLIAEPPGRLRGAGLAAAVVGLGVVWVLRG